MNFFSQIASFCVGNDEKGITDDAKDGNESQVASSPALSPEQVRLSVTNLACHFVATRSA